MPFRQQHRTGWTWPGIALLVLAAWVVDPTRYVLWSAALAVLVPVVILWHYGRASRGRSGFARVSLVDWAHADASPRGHAHASRHPPWFMY